MSEKYDIAIIGGDLRQVYMANEFAQKGYKTIAYGIKDEKLSDLIKSAESMEEALEDSLAIICPVPLSKNKTDITSIGDFNGMEISKLLMNLKSGSTLFGGNIPKEVQKCCKEKSIACYDLMAQNDIAIKNAIATAEGAILEAISKSPITLHQSGCLVLGFGRCAKILAKKLYALDASVTIAARNKDQRAEAEAYGYYALPLDMFEQTLPDYDFIFNTIPALVLPRSALKITQPDVTIIDIASSPGGVDFAAAEAMKINASLCPSLPGRYAPKTSGEILYKAIEDILIESSD